jgi:membrane-anchored glycerophosphoryl diester phosphodiesterase (GDPDase)
MNNLINIDSASLISLAWIALLVVIAVVVPIAIIGCIAFCRAPVNRKQNPAYTFSQLFERRGGAVKRSQGDR